ncbi:MAG: hypothetical protein HN742_09455 [Lentisphaerae bacterium]|jgi:hypothetical protein|nr:hypothetical protein [Lentisphaerota bacterium]MBT5606716.1 hypothetical protein [Lentisphaerota bacterium]MBT7056981.1 hypothetical protein [Lentisphaerota bacterium]MBT7842088.1 hypothetical protein [Lentisphaerota bacterium]
MGRHVFCMFWVFSAVLVADSIDIPELRSAPTLDGALDDAAWETANRIETLYLQRTATPFSDTTVFLGRDTAWLYLGFKCDNPTMPHVSQTAFKHDDAVCRDESVEIFLSPDGKQYGHFMLGFANVTHDKKIEKGMRDVGWNPVWRTATRRLPTGWTAEAAIPLYALGGDGLAEAHINLMRNLVTIELDPYGAVQDERRVFRLLNPNAGSPHDMAGFSRLNGFGGFTPTIPFAPRIDTVSLSSYQQKADGQRFYSVALSLIAGTPVSGETTVKILEDSGWGYVEKVAKTIRVDGMNRLSLDVAVRDFQPRAVTVALDAPDTGDRLAEQVIADTSMLNVIQEAVVERNYYTAEEVARIRVRSSLSDAALRTSRLQVAAGGRTLAETRGLRPEEVVEIPVDKLALGENALALSLSEGGRQLATTTIMLRRLKPRPGFEVKTDRFRGVVLKDGTPFFPVGIVMHGVTSKHEQVFKFLAEEIGFNTLVRSGTYKDSTYRSDLNDAQAYMDLAVKYGFSVVNWGTGKQPHPIDGKPLPERLRIHRAKYDQLEPAIVRETEILRDSPNMLAYWNVDEPNLLNKEARIAAAEWYFKTVDPIDPYRPQFLLYSKHIPHGDKWTRWGEVLGYDVYPRPYVGGMYSEPGLATAYYSCDLRDRCRRDTKVQWFVPLSSHLGPPRAPIGMSRAHLLCQAYTTLIYGSRGLLYFVLSSVVGEEAWGGLKTIAAQVKMLSPALLEAPPKQVVSYTPGALRPAERQFPVVNVATFRYPDGAYLLLAANIKPFAVDSTFTVTGLTAVERCFHDGVQPPVTASAFTERIEPYGVRAYRLKLDRTDCIEVAVDMAVVPGEAAPFVDVVAIVQQLKRSRNHCPNPVFRQCTNPGIPDFCKPFFCLGIDLHAGQQGSDWYLDGETPWNGNPSLRMARRPIDQETARGVFAVAYPPPSDTPQTMTFSFYAKGQGAKDSVTFVGHGLTKTQKAFPVSETWERYHLTFDVSPAENRDMGGRVYILCPGIGSTVWINGLQLEEGDQPTEFRDDSVLKKKR